MMESAGSAECIVQSMCRFVQPTFELKRHLGTEAQRVNTAYKKRQGAIHR